MYKGETSIKDYKVGNSTVKSIYKGGDKIYDYTPPDTGLTRPLLIRFTTSNRQLTFNNTTGSPIQLKKKTTPNGEWSTLTINTGTTTYTHTSTNLFLGGKRASYGYYNSETGDFGFLEIKASGTTKIELQYNIMSLIDYENFADLTSFQEGYERIFWRMFRNSTGLLSISNLRLPATNLPKMCYSSMFDGCTGLTASTQTLSATTLGESCYNSMFKGCTSLRTAPELPATTLATRCYDSMFSGCTRLNSVKCLATDISATDCTYDWLSSVASTGTFTKNPSMNNWTRGTSGIPSNWTVVDAS